MTESSPRRGLRIAQAGWGAAALGAISFALANATPAAAMSAQDCAAQANNVAVRAVAISPGETITLQRTLDGTYQGDATAEVYCRRRSDGANVGPITDAKVRVSIDPDTSSGFTASMFSVTGLGVPVANVNSSSPGNPVVIGPFTGTATFRITAPDTLLPEGMAAMAVGTHLEVVAEGYGAPLIDPATGATLKPGTMGDVLAQTPEVGSVALFGSGALGMAGYALMRLRAGRRAAK